MSKIVWKNTLNAYRVWDYGKAFCDVPMASRVDTELHIVQPMLPIVIWNPSCKSKITKTNKLIINRTRCHRLEIYSNRIRLLCVSMSSNKLSKAESSIAIPFQLTAFELVNFTAKDTHTRKPISLQWFSTGKISKNRNEMPIHTHMLFSASILIFFFRICRRTELRYEFVHEIKFVRVWSTHDVGSVIIVLGIPE